jgi:glyoxylase-like metal-dependent hydrolase (beta-lactamase superfamily II)
MMYLFSAFNSRGTSMPEKDPSPAIAHIEAMTRATGAGRARQRSRSPASGRLGHGEPWRWTGPEANDPFVMAVDEWNHHMPRHLLRWCSCWIIAGCLLLLEQGVFGQHTGPGNEITKLTDDVYVFRHQFHQSIFIITSRGVIVTDPIAPDAAAWLKAEIKKLTDQPVRYVIYSHHHDDHISGGDVFADTAVFVSHWAARRELMKEPHPQIPVPELTFTDRLFIEVGGKRVELIYTGRNHSDNSLVLFLPDNKLLFAVDFIPVETGRCGAIIPTTGSNPSSGWRNWISTSWCRATEKSGERRMCDCSGNISKISWPR